MIATVTGTEYDGENNFLRVLVLHRKAGFKVRFQHISQFHYLITGTDGFLPFGTAIRIPYLCVQVHFGKQGVNNTFCDFSVTGGCNVLTNDILNCIQFTQYKLVYLFPVLGGRKFGILEVGYDRHIAIVVEKHIIPVSSYTTNFGKDLFLIGDCRIFLDHRVNLVAVRNGLGGSIIRTSHKARVGSPGMQTQFLKLSAVPPVTTFSGRSDGHIGRTFAEQEIVTREYVL